MTSIDHYIPDPRIAERQYGGYNVAVVGGRDFNDEPWLFDVLDEYHRRFYIHLIVSGGATGADTFAENWAKKNQIDKLIYYAKWNLYGKAAGNYRNKLIVESSEVVIAFPTFKSVGTLNTINEAKLLGKLIYVFGPAKTDFEKYT